MGCRRTDRLCEVADLPIPKLTGKLKTHQMSRHVQFCGPVPVPVVSVYGHVVSCNLAGNSFWGTKRRPAVAFPKKSKEHRFQWRLQRLAFGYFLGHIWHVQVHVHMDMSDDPGGSGV